MILFTNITLKNTLMENSVRMPETYVVYSHTIYRQNARIYEPKTIYSRIQAACNNILAMYFDLFL